MTQETRTYQPGEVIIEHGQPSQYAFHILSGAVEILLHKDQKILSLATLGPEEIFGETALFENCTYGATVKAIEPTTVEVITKDMLEGLLKGTDPLLKRIIKALITRQNQTNTSLLESETREFMDVDLI